MTRDELNNKYFDWMCQLVCKRKYTRGLSYRKLLSHLHGIDFEYTIDMDGNRAEDGVNLRYRFGYERSYEETMIASYLDNRPCSVLEMMVALAVRCEEQIMYDPDIGDRKGQWFWDMLYNLGLDFMDDSKYDADFVDETVYRFLDRDYKRNGEGGLFVINNDRDARSAEIWDQMLWYLNDIL